jgi:hypothetical protein
LSWPAIASRGCWLNTHEHYEELCALAATGQASESELQDLRSHLGTCPSCRSVAYDFTQLSVQALSELAAKRLRRQVPAGMPQRFVARAHSEGIEISDQVRPKESGRNRDSPSKLIAVGAAVATVVLLASFGIFKFKFQGPPTDRAPMAAIASSRPSDSQKPSEAADTAESHVTEEFVNAQKQLTSMEAVLKAQRAELESWKRTTSTLASQLSETQQQNAAFERERSEREGGIKQLEAELAKMKSEDIANVAVTAAEENQVRDLQKKVSEQSEALKQQQALSAKGSDVRDLVVARNLHIIDVHDRDGNGKNQRTFGRIFYTEGKSLIVYAYDLADPHKLNAKISFHVWGERLGSEKPIRSLGVLRNDDAAEGRWVLTFDDPQTLAQIDSVFVTAESSQKLTKEPRGERILFAFLGGNPNHP